MKKECWDAIQKMKNDKSPRSDGLTKEFYVCFFNEVSNILITALNYSFTTGMLSASQRQELITITASGTNHPDREKRLR